jgi:Na+-driven multidrug efflux pump
MGTTPLALLITIIATHITVIIPLLALPNCVAFSTSFSSISTARWRNIHRSLRLTKLMELAHDRSSQHQQPPHMERLPLLARRDDDDSSSNSRSSSISSHSSKASSATTASLILGLAVPALVGEIIDPLLTLADTAFVGRFATITTAATTTAAQTSTESVAASLLAGLGSASAILSFSFYLFNFLCTATTPLISRKRAEAEQNATSTTTTSTTTTDEAALSVSGQALTLALLLGCIVTSLLVSFSQPLLYLMGTSQTGPDANQYATSFLTIRAFAAPAVFLNSASVGILRGFLDTKTSTIILLAANIINFTLDVLFIPVLHMVPTTGAAVSAALLDRFLAFRVNFISFVSMYIKTH